MNIFFLKKFDYIYTKIKDLRAKMLDCLYSMMTNSSATISYICLQCPERHSRIGSGRSRSFEQREEDYEKARKRIFNHDAS